jgi:hypothetical protein
MSSQLRGRGGLKRLNKLSIKMIEALACLKSWYKLKEFILDEDLFIGPKIKDQE